MVSEVRQSPGSFHCSVICSYENVQIIQSIYFSAVYSSLLRCVGASAVVTVDGYKVTLSAEINMVKKALINDSRPKAFHSICGIKNLESGTFNKFNSKNSIR